MSGKISIMERKSKLGTYLLFALRWNIHSKISCFLQRTILCELVVNRPHLKLHYVFITSSNIFRINFDGTVSGIRGLEDKCATYKFLRHCCDGISLVCGEHLHYVAVSKGRAW